MQLLTYATLPRSRTGRWRGSGGGGLGGSKPAMLFSVWLIMFLSKFVFLGAIDVHLR